MIQASHYRNPEQPDVAYWQCGQCKAVRRFEPWMLPSSSELSVECPVCGIWNRLPGPKDPVLGPVVSGPTPDELDLWFTLQRPAPGQAALLDAIREGYRGLAYQLRLLTKAGPEQAASYLQLRVSMQLAIASVVCQPKA